MFVVGGRWGEGEGKCVSACARAEVDCRLRRIKKKSCGYVGFNLHWRYMEVLRRAIRIYQRESGERPFVTWMRSLRDVRGKQAIEARLARVSLGNLGKRGQPPPYCESGS
jgi:hypothetical protein